MAVEVTLTLAGDPLLATGAAALAEARGWGLLRALAMPAPLAVIASLLLLDLAIWAQHVLMHRVSVASRHDRTPIAPREEELLADIRRAYPLSILARWREEGERLIQATDTFHLDKRETLRLLMEPSLLERIAV